MTRGERGTFLICTFWLAQALAEAGERDRARRRFEQAIAYINDVGLLSEEVDPQSGKLLGNYPQAFGHIELVNAAWAISQPEQAVRASAAVHRSPVKAIAVFPGQASKLHLRNVTEPGLEHSDLATSACRPGASRPRPASAFGRSLRGECA